MPGRVKECLAIRAEFSGELNEDEVIRRAKWREVVRQLNNKFNKQREEEEIVVGSSSKLK